LRVPGIRESRPLSPPSGSWTFRISYLSEPKIKLGKALMAALGSRKKTVRRCGGRVRERERLRKPFFRSLSGECSHRFLKIPGMTKSIRLQVYSRSPAS
jgi:hypothetical protein